MAPRLLNPDVRRCIASGLAVVLVLISLPPVVAAAEHRGQVRFGGVPVPGAVVTISQNGKTLAAITETDGTYVFPALADGLWNVEIEMQGFATLREDVMIGAVAAVATWDLKMLPLNAMKAEAAPSAAALIPPSSPAAVAPRPPARPTAPAQAPFQRAAVSATAANGAAAPADSPTPSANSAFANVSADELNQRAADGLLINGSVNNGAASPFAQSAAFGNNRRTRPLYTGNLSVRVDSSALNARTYSLTGQDIPKTPATRIQGVVNVGGPLRIPHILNNGPTFFLGLQRTQNRNAPTSSFLMPTEAERSGDFSSSRNAQGQPVQVFDPLSGLPFLDNRIPDNRVSPQAKALLAYYPLPNLAGNPRFNYQIPIISTTHQDGGQLRLNKSVGSRNQLAGNVDYQNTRTDNPNVFGFLDQSTGYNVNAVTTWNRRHSQRFSSAFRLQFIRSVSRVTPYFSGRQNVAADAGITGNNQDAANWGPPGLTFLNGLAPLADSPQSFTRTQSASVGYNGSWSRGRHVFTFGADYRRQQFNTLSQQDARGTFTFTGAATQSGLGTGSDFADFLLGTPDVSAIAFGNADKYFRQSFYDGFLTDDWRMNPTLTLQLGARWEYESPITETQGRLVNLDLLDGFGGAAPVIGSTPIGPLSGRTFARSLVRPDRYGIEPRLGFAWRPVSGSSLVVRGGYGIYRNTAVYQSLALQMAQQSPLSTSLSVQNTVQTPLTLANGFVGSPATTPTTFAVDPDFKVGYAENWQVSVQRDLPFSLQMTSTYLGTRGRRLMQQSLPNTVPAGGVDPCPLCPRGFAYLSSNGNSKRHAGQFQLRRRLKNGFTATAQYTFAKAIDNAGFSSVNPLVAQNWLDLNAERSLSSFDQRHQLTVQSQYTTGMGLGGGALMGGWRGTLLKAWTLTSSLSVGSGTPLTPVFGAAAFGTGVTGSIRPDLTGVSSKGVTGGPHINPAAFHAPASGQWGNAGRNSIAGPGQFSLNGSLNRAFQVSERLGMDVGIDATNILNHATFPTWNTTTTSAQFGLPTRVNPMRSLQTTVRLRF